MNGEYLGDGVYAEISNDGEYLVLTTQDGISVTNKIYIDSEVLRNLKDYIKRNTK